MSGTRRRPVVREHRSAGFSPEVIRLFRELEAVRPSRRFDDPRTKTLARLLGLGSELMCSIAYVSDDSAYRPTGRPMDQDHQRVRAVRAQLLLAAGTKPDALRKAKPAAIAKCVKTALEKCLAK